MKIGLILCSVLPVICSHAQTICSEAGALIDQIRDEHIQPRRIDKNFTSAVSVEFLKELDPEQTLFTWSDTTSLEVFRHLDDTKTCKLTESALKLFRTKATRYKNLVDSILSKPLDYTKAESIPGQIGGWTLATTRRELENNISKNLKYEIMRSMFRQAAADSVNLLSTPAFLRFEPAARQRVRKNALLTVNRLLANEPKLRGFIEESFLDAIAKSFDPHSAYFGKTGMRNFYESLNTSELSFGIKLKVSQIGEVVVAGLIPEGPAWRSAQFHEGDALIGLTWSDSKEYVDLIDVDIEMMNGILHSGDENTANFSVRNADGQVQHVELTRVLLQNEDNMILSLILTGKESKRKIGYIALTGFFIDDENKYEGCATAVTRELIKLKGEGIDGLIFDLRFNGGGSMQEAVELAGLFIKQGPVVLTEKIIGGKVEQKIAYDRDTGQMYPGPLVIMTNAASASASEIVAGTLQDYGRAVVVGTPTYGKATGQLVVPFMGDYLKVTDMRIYRASGKSHQREGIIPNFTIPDLSHLQFYRETDNDNTLSPMPTTMKPGYERSSSTFEKVSEYSKKSVLPKEFQALEKLRKVMTSEIPLEINSFIAVMQNVRQWDFEMYSDPGKKNNVYTVSNGQYDIKTLEGDLYHSEMNKLHIREITASIHIPEAFKLIDFLLSKKK